MKVNLAVCGIFHYRKYIGSYSSYRTLQNFYFSHKITSTRNSLRIESGRAVNLWLKEYLLRAGMAMMPWSRQSGRMDSMLHGVWEQQLLGRWQPCDLFQVMLHGTAERAIERAKNEGAVTVGEPVMTHPEVLQHILEEEHERLCISPPPPMWKSFQRLQQEAANCDRLVVGSRVIRDSFVAQGFPVEQTHVLPYGSDTQHFFPLTAEERERIADDKFRVICVAQITPRKGIHYLLEAWKRLGLSKSRSELLLVGQISDCMRPVLARYEGLYTHLSSIPHEQLRLHYGRSTAFVLPSVEDGFGYVTTEAMGCGLPAVVSDAAGSAEVVENGVTGFVVPARSVDAIEASLTTLHRDHDLRTEMSVRAAMSSRDRLRWSDYAARLVQLHARWCGEPPQ